MDSHLHLGLQKLQMGMSISWEIIPFNKSDFLLNEMKMCALKISIQLLKKTKQTFHSYFKLVTCIF